MNNRLHVKLLPLIVSAACAGMSASFALAAEEVQKSAQKMEEMVVTATKTAKDTSEAPATVSVVTSKDIDKMNVQSVDEALTYLPGVYTNRPGGHEPSVMGTNVLLRGIPDYSRTLVLVDGQTLNDPYIGAVTWESVPAETVERIEVVPGPFSSLYGGSAMGGVINIITKAPTKREFSLKGGVGTNNFQSGSLVYQDRLGERIGIVLDYAHKQSDGYIKDEVVIKPGTAGGTIVTGAQRTTDSSGNAAYLVGDKGTNGWNSQNLGVKLYVDLPADSRLTLGASQFLYESTGRNHYNTYLRDAAGNPVVAGNVTVAGTSTNLTVREKDFLTGPDSEIKEYNRYTAEYEKQLGKGSTLKATLGYSDMPLYNNYFVLGSAATLANGGSASRMLRPSNELSGTVQASFPLADSHYLVAGVSGNKRKIDTITYSVSDWRDAGITGPVQNQTSGEDTTYALFVQDEITLSPRLTAYLGGRYDSWSTEGYIEQVRAPAYKNEYTSRSQTHFSPKASMVYRPGDTTTLRGSIGNSFHAPNLRDTFGWWTPQTGYTYTPNPDLKPETVTSMELGIEQQVGSGTLLRATIYESRLKDLIYRTQSDTLMEQSVANAGVAKVKGIELEVRQKLMNGLTAFANLTFNDSKITENQANPATEGKYMTRTPRKMANIGLQGVQGPWSGSLTGHYVGKVYNNDENLDTASGVYGSYDAYFITNAKLSYAIKKGLKLSLSANNLFDRDYYESSRAMGRAVYGEIAWQM
ncbi:MAG: TonB-dependent receptor [Gammaproteobacteria bacterium]|nr:TonB-dependent receptor [Gammaproteobacteria bacterium]MBU1733118.1 TonB-dependent receptor [Gammaproteobacteria bacterium]MBU1892166.1 TonB-dependent receptor [Gammaproteobacteria bacterium]